MDRRNPMDASWHQHFMGLRILSIFRRSRTAENIAFALPDFCGKIDSAMADARNRSPRDRRREFSPSWAPEMSNFACKHYRRMSAFACAVGYVRGKGFCIRSQLRKTRISRPQAATSRKRKLCIFSATNGAKMQFWLMKKLKKFT